MLIGRHRIEWPSPRLPGEMTDEIIAWIPNLGEGEPEYYYPMLLSCCLVCSEWLPASRHQLFPHLYIASAQSYDLFVSQVLPQDSMRVYLSRVRALTLTNPVNELERGRSSIPFSYAFVGHLPNLTALDVYRGGVMTYLCRHLRTPLALSRFSSIRELHIYSDTFPSFGDVRRTLTSLLNLTILNMRTDVSWPEPAAELSPPIRSPSPRPRIVELSYRCGTTFNERDRRRANQFLTWLASTSTGSSLRRLTFHSFPAESEYTFGDLCGPEFFKNVATCVDELKLGI